MKKLLLLLLLLVPLVSAQDWMYTSDTAYMNIKLGSDIELTPITSIGEQTADYLEVMLLFYPRDDPIQSVGSVTISPSNYIISNEMIKFRWDKPKENTFSYDYEADVAVTTSQPIRRKVSYPITNLPNDLIQYTLPTEQIDATYPEIMDTAAQLASGEDDLYKVTYSIGAWIINNIDYTLDTLTAEAAQKASWVIDHRYGVCDEITTLFIAMLRSLGVPARYVSGVAYTNWENMNDWGSHAWAEVYFPGHGWVPFDITYGQFGLIDNSHISLKKSSDVDSTSTKFEWLGTNLQLETEQLDIKTELTSTTGRTAVPIELDISLYRDEIGFGSYNIVEASVTNTANYYFASELGLAKTQEIEIVGDERRLILLKPGEQKFVHWLIKLPPTLNPDYIYTFPVEVYTTRNITASAYFNSDRNAPVYSYSDIKDLIDVETQQQTQPTSDVILVCSAQKENYYLDQDITATCDVISTQAVDDLNVCVLSRCQTIDLEKSSSESLTFTFNLNLTGRRDIIVTAKNSKVSKATSFAVNMAARPKLTIEFVEAPKAVRYGDVFDISFVLMREEASPKNVVIRLDHDGTLQRWRVEELANNKKFIITTDSRSYREGTNTYNIIVTYEDNDGNEYVAKESLSISLIDVTALQKLQIFFNQLGRWLQQTLS